MPTLSSSPRSIRQRLAGPSVLVNPTAPVIGWASDECLTEFAHDMRSPLTSLQVLADGLQLGWSTALTPLQRRQLRMIHGVAQALNAVISNTMQMRRTPDELEESKPRRFSVIGLLSQIQNLVSPLAILKGLELNFIRPEQDQRVGSPSDLHRILLNLVTNALKFTRAGGVTVSALDGVDGAVEFAVQDTGPGIDQAAQQTLFHPFRRSHGLPKFSSTRLGLTISQRLVHALGGELQYETAPSTGTRFFFVLNLPVPHRV